MDKKPTAQEMTAKFYRGQTAVEPPKPMKGERSPNTTGDMICGDCDCN